MTSLLAPTTTSPLAASTATTLADFPAATSAYIHDQVEVKVGAVTENLQSGEDGTYTLRWTNAPDGVRLHDVTLHITVSPDTVAQLLVPGSALLQPREVNDINSPRPPTNSQVPELYVFLPSPGSVIPTELDSRLDVGETGELELEYHAEAAGKATFSAHIHATVAFEDLFPRGRGDAATKEVKILP